MLETVYKYFFPVAVILGVFLWVAGEYSTIAPITIVAPKVLVASPGIISNGNREVIGTIQLQGNYEGTGVPFIFFSDEKGRTIAKQLIFVNARGCSVGAGDLPCARTRDDTAYPDLKTGTRVSIQGNIVDDRFFVQKLTIL